MEKSPDGRPLELRFIAIYPGLARETLEELLEPEDVTPETAGYAASFVKPLMEAAPAQAIELMHTGLDHHNPEIATMFEELIPLVSEMDQERGERLTRKLSKRET